MGWITTYKGMDGLLLLIGEKSSKVRKLIKLQWQNVTPQYECVCVGIPFILDVSLVDAPAGVTQEKGHAGFLHLPSAVLALIFIARRIQPSLSLADREVEFCVPTN